MSGSEIGGGTGESVRLSVRISPEVRDAINKIMALGKMGSVAEALRRAIGDELFLQEQKADGWKVLVTKDNQYREVVWPKF
jgi:hypothetical protein